jgi:hypothetical protein
MFSDRLLSYVMMLFQLQKLHSVRLEGNNAMNVECLRICRDMVVACFCVLSLNSHDYTEENYINVTCNEAGRTTVRVRTTIAFSGSYYTVTHILIVLYSKICNNRNLKLMH